VFNFDYSEETLEQQYRDYFEIMIKGIQSGLFDVVGHLDLVKRPGYPVLDTNREDVEKVLAAVKGKGMSIELNTSGLRKPIGEIYPAMKIIEMVIKKQIPIAMASDAHRPEHVGYRFDQLLNRLFRYDDFMLAHYRKRKCTSRRLAQPGTEWHEQ
jgi:histidinol-phosphatase (PHP family)